MDPLENLCILSDSFSDEKEKNRLYTIPTYSEEYAGSPRARRNRLVEKEERRGKNVLKNPKLNDVKIEGRFSHHSSYVLANIDTIYNFSRQENGYLIPQVLNKDFKYVIVDSDLGFLEYMQYRMPESIALTNCLKEGTLLSLPYNNLDMNCDNGLIGYVNDVAPEGADVVLSNKGFENGTALQICKKGGTYISKLNEINLEQLYLLTMCFKKFSLFHPFLSSNIYIVAENFSGNSLDIIPLFNQSISVPDSFTDYITTFLQNVTPTQEYNLYRCKALMNVE